MWYMRRSGATAASFANGTTTISAGRAASSSCVTVIVATGAVAAGTALTGTAPTGATLTGATPTGATSNSAPMAAPRQASFTCSPSGDAGPVPRDQGTTILGSTTVQNAHFGLPEVSNSSGRLVRATGKPLSQV